MEGYYEKNIKKGLALVLGVVLSAAALQPTAIKVKAATTPTGDLTTNMISRNLE